MDSKTMYLHSIKLNRYKLPTGRMVVEPPPLVKLYLKQLNQQALTYYEQLLQKYQLNDIPQAYRKKHSIKTNAKLHQYSPILYKFDFTHFYDSIPYEIIKPHLLKLNATTRKDYYIDPETNGLIQGSPLSGTLAGLALIPFWLELKKRLPKAIITQYSDDLTISNITLSKKECHDLILDVLHKTNTPCRLNEKKTTVHEKQYRRVTGVALNHKNQITCKRQDYRHVRATLHGVSKLNKSFSDYGYRDKQHFDQVLSYYKFIDDTGKINKLLLQYNYQ